MKTLSLILIKFYQHIISPIIGKNCRFFPSCSHYSHQAISQYGFMTGLWMSIRRITRCHPFNRGGYDPITTSKRSLL